MGSRRTLDAFTTRPPRGRSVEVQVSVDGGTPLVWSREDGAPPTIVRGTAALRRLHQAIGRALEVARHGDPRPTTAGQLDLEEVAGG